MISVIHWNWFQTIAINLTGKQMRPIYKKVCKRNTHTKSHSTKWLRKPAWNDKKSNFVAFSAHFGWTLHASTMARTKPDRVRICIHTHTESFLFFWTWSRIALTCWAECEVGEQLNWVWVERWGKKENRKKSKKKYQDRREVTGTEIKWGGLAKIDSVDCEFYNKNAHSAKCTRSGTSD